jgi:hypothetical protein
MVPDQANSSFRIYVYQGGFMVVIWCLLGLLCDFLVVMISCCGSTPRPGLLIVNATYEAHMQVDDEVKAWISELVVGNVLGSDVRERTTARVIVYYDKQFDIQYIIRLC